MKLIELRNGYKVCVDDCDYLLVSSFKWKLSRGRRTYYAVSQDEHGKFLNMHRLIMGLQYGDHREIDHIDGNGWNNCRNNLRIVTRQQNMFNQRPQDHRISQYRGVGWHRKQHKWRARCRVNGKLYHLGLFDTETAAAREYNRFASVCFGEYAYLNECPTA